MHKKKNISHIVPQFRGSNLDVGESRRVLLAPGDAVIAHQRLAHCAGLNLSPKIRKNLYFRVEHKQFPSFAKAYASAPNPWMGFAGLSKFLPEQATTIPDEESVSEGEDGTGISQALRDVLAIRGCSLEALPDRIQDLVQLSEQQKNIFTNNGFLVLQDVVSSSLIRKAIEKITRAYTNEKYRERKVKKYEGSSRGILSFGKHVCQSPALTNVFTMSGLVTAAESLLGSEQVVLKGGKADVMYVPTSDLFVQEGRDMTFCVQNAEWSWGLIENSKQPPDANHFLTVCVLLSNGNKDSVSVPLMVWPGKSNWFYQSMILKGMVLLLLSADHFICNELCNLGKPGSHEVLSNTFSEITNNVSLFLFISIFIALFSEEICYELNLSKLMFVLTCVLLRYFFHGIQNSSYDRFQMTAKLSGGSSHKNTTQFV